MRIFDLALKDMYQLSRDWRTFVFLLVSPIIFTLFFGMAFGGQTPGESDPRLPVGFRNEDASTLSLLLEDRLAQSDVIRLETGGERAALEKQLTEETIAALVVIPAGFGDSLIAGDPLQLELVAPPSASSSASVEMEVRAAAGQLAGAVISAQIGLQTYEQKAQFAGEAARQAYFDAALAQAAEQWGALPVTVEMVAAVAESAAGPEISNAYAHSSPGMMAQFAIAGLMGAAGIIVRERKSRALQRLITTAITRLEILLGHFLAMFAMILAQYVLLIAFGQLFLGLRYDTSWAATALVTVSMALASAAMGLLLGALAQTEEQVIIGTLIPMFVFAGLGGAWVPLEFTPPAIQSLGHITPVAWMMDGFKNILIRGQGLDAALLPAGALLGFALLFFSVGVWRFRVE